MGKSYLGNNLNPSIGRLVPTLFVRHDHLVEAVVGAVTMRYVGGYFEWHTNGVLSASTKYYSAGGARIAMRQMGVVTYLFGDHLGSTSVAYDDAADTTRRQGYTAFGSERYRLGEDLPTRYQFTGQRGFEEFGLQYYGARWYDGELGRFAQADTIIPEPGNPMAWDRFAYSRNSPTMYIDPTGHAYCASHVPGAMCMNDNANSTPMSQLTDQAIAILSELGGKNDLEAMAQISDAAYHIFGTYKYMVPALTKIFNGQGGSNPLTIWYAALSDGCGGVGRDRGDCPTGYHFEDKGFHKDFQDGHNQLFHFWAYFATVASSECSQFYAGCVVAGHFVADLGNFVHEFILTGRIAGSAQDLALAQAGINTGFLVALGLIPPNQLGNYLRYSLGPDGPGSFGIVSTFAPVFPPLQ